MGPEGTQSLAREKKEIFLALDQAKVLRVPYIVNRISHLQNKGHMKKCQGVIIILRCLIINLPDEGLMSLISKQCIE